MQPEEVFGQICRAVRTMRKLPPVGVKQRFCNWPEVVRSFYEAYGYNDPTPPRLSPTPRQLDEMDEVIEWLAWLSRYGEEYPRIVWARAENLSWRSIGELAGMNKETCKRRFQEGVYAIHFALDKSGISATGKNKLH